MMTYTSLGILWSDKNVTSYFIRAFRRHRGFAPDRKLRRFSDGVAAGREDHRTPG
jgi:hypothetical protein